MHLDLSEAERELFDEPAAILEYMAGWPRPIAESDAIRQVLYRRWLRGEFRLDSLGRRNRIPGARLISR